MEGSISLETLRKITRIQKSKEQFHKYINECYDPSDFDLETKTIPDGNNKSIPEEFLQEFLGNTTPEKQNLSKRATCGYYLSSINDEPFRSVFEDRIAQIALNLDNNGVINVIINEIRRCFEIKGEKITATRDDVIRAIVCSINHPSWSKLIITSAMVKVFASSFENKADILSQSHVSKDYYCNFVANFFVDQIFFNELNTTSSH